jgi:hypothetical protein
MSRFVMSNAGRRATQIAAAVIAAVALAACGGGGSGSTVVEKPGVALHTSAGSVITVAVGSTNEYTVGGGGGGSNFVKYTATSSDLKVATATIDGTKLKIAGLVPGEAAVVITDSVGASVALTVKVPASSLPKVTVNAPEKLTFTSGMTSQYKVSGGIGPYSVAVSNPTVIAAAAGKDTVSVTAANPGASTVIVYDSLGNSTKLDVTVSGGGASNVPLYTTAPESIRLSGKSTAEFSVNGGAAPYTITSSDTTVVTGTINGNQLIVSSTGTVGRGLINIRDANGVLEVITVNVIGDIFKPLYTTAPAGITLTAGGQSAYAIEGGTAPYLASTSNNDVARATVVEGNQLQIRGISAGVADVMVFDSTGASVKVSATVGGGTGAVPLYTTAPDSITVLVGAAPTYQLAGGAAPYTVTSSTVDVATVTQTATSFTVTGVKAGSAVVAIRDANGTAKNITVTVR